MNYVDHLGAYALAPVLIGIGLGFTAPAWVLPAAIGLTAGTLIGVGLVMAKEAWDEKGHKPQKGKGKFTPKKRKSHDKNERGKRDKKRRKGRFKTYKNCK